MTMVSRTCQIGGGEPDDRRDIITNVLMGGTKLAITLNAEFGAPAITGAMRYGARTKSITGPMSACASAIWFTAAPMATINAPNARYVMRKNTTLR
jgi:hypothetical protein